jgi:hypothetical protein
MWVIIPVGIILQLMAGPSSAESYRSSCDLMTQENRQLESARHRGLPLYRIHLNVYFTSFDEIDLSTYTTIPDTERGYLRALNHFIRESNTGSVSAIYRDLVNAKLEKLTADQRHYEYHRERLTEQRARKLFGSTVQRTFESLAVKRHKPSLRCLGHIYRYGIGVEVDLAKAWGFYDTYNLVAGIDGKDEFRSSVSEVMTEVQILEGQGYARTFRELYTDAWKVPSMTIIR